MQRQKKIIVGLMVIFLLVISSVKTKANLLAECGTCNATGNCSSCNAAKEITCDQCNGKRTVICDQCNGTGEGSCDACGGNGTDRNEDRVCGQCNGSGKEVCHSCSGDLIMKCNGCFGNGKKPCFRCNNTGICPDCKGTGYRDGQNNGTTNVPKKGDTVQKLNNTTVIWKDSGDNTEKDTISNPVLKKESESKVTIKPVLKEEKKDVKIKENSLDEKAKIVATENVIEEFNLPNVTNLSDDSTNKVKMINSMPEDNTQQKDNEKNMNKQIKENSFALLYIVVSGLIIFLVAIIVKKIKGKLS